MTDLTDRRLNTLQPDPSWIPAGFDDDLAVLDNDAHTFRVWGGDWCSDCRQQLPAFGAALAELDVPESRVHDYPVEKADDGSKMGEQVEAYDVERIPTVVVEADGEEVARFVESADRPIVAELARQLRA
ncbi:MAG: TlpA family protein disulfide reductase [Halolamina sp.]